jgi:hypothetical protein
MDEPTLTTQVALLNQSMAILLKSSAEHDRKAEERFDKLEAMLMEQNEKGHAVTSRVSRLELIVFGIGGPAAIAAFGAVIRLLTGD